MAEVVLTKVSDHGRTNVPRENIAGFKIGSTTFGHSEWTVVWGEGANRRSKTLHCSEATAEAEKSRLKGVE